MSAENQVELLEQSVRKFSEIVNVEKNQSSRVTQTLVPIVFSILGVVFGFLTLFGF